MQATKKLKSIFVKLTICYLIVFLVPAQAGWALESCSSILFLAPHKHALKNVIIFFSLLRGNALLMLL
jgi:hypothetical protein